MNTKEAVEIIRKHWDFASSNFDQGHDTEDLDAWRSVLSELLGPETWRNVLDLGTGTGFLANLTAELGYPTVGMDISEQMMAYGVRHSASRKTGVMYLKGSALELPFMDANIDAIINARLIWTLVEPELALKEWYRVLRPGGKILCFNRMTEGVGMTAKPGFFAYGSEEIDGMLSLRRASMDEMKEMLRRCGYENVEIHKLPGLTREGFDYEPWFVLMGSRPVTEREKAEKSLSAFWDKSAMTYEARHALADIPHWQELLSSYIGPDLKQKIVDVATGTGMIANMLGSYGYEDVTGTDISEGMMHVAIAHAREQKLRIRYLYANALSLPFEDESVDVVISSRLLWTLPEPENALKEWMRVLKPGGKMIAINQLTDGEIRSHSFDHPELYLGEGVNADSFLFANTHADAILHLIEACGYQNVRLTHMDGCRMADNGKEDWYLFYGVKP